MHTQRILQRCLGAAWATIHGHRRQALAGAVEATAASHRLTLTELARHWPGAQRVAAPLKRLDRLLSNPRLMADDGVLRTAMGRHLLRGDRPVILVDWADLKGDSRWSLLRAAVPMGGRALTLYERVFPVKRQNSPKAQAEFLDALWRLLAPGQRPILVTDAGFRSDWYRQVQGRGGHCIGRVRGNVCVRRGTDDWALCTSLYDHATKHPRTLGDCELVRGDPWPVVLMQHRRPPRGRHRHTRAGRPSRDRRHQEAQCAGREPWLLAVSPGLDLSPRAVMNLYARRMQIEESFRDLKCPRFGVGLRYSLTRTAPRLQALLLLNALVAFAAWIAGTLVRSGTCVERLQRAAPARPTPTLSILRMGREALRHQWLDPIPSLKHLLQCLQPLPLPE